MTKLPSGRPHKHNGHDTLVVNKHEKEFSSSRLLLQENLPEFPHYPYLNHSKRGYILWPEGVTGSLTHKKNLIAFVTSKNKKSTYGVDLEEVRVPRKVFLRVTNEKEQTLLESSWSKEENPTLLYTLVFSIKESLFKSFSQDEETHFPRVLKDCVITSFDFQTRSFSGSFEKEGEKKKIASGEFSFVNFEEEKEARRMVLTFCSSPRSGRQCSVQGNEAKH